MTELMLTERRTRLSFDDYLTTPIPITNGNNQGCPLSMMFYAFYNAGLLELSPPESPDERQFGFVDDVALLATGNTIEEAHRKLKNMMERTGGALEWSTSHNSPFEMTKLAMMNFSPKTLDTTPLTITHTGINRTTTIKAVNSYRFLGVLFDPKLRWKAQHERAIRNAEMWINLVKRLARTASGVSASGMRQLYLTVAAPRMTYAAEIWYTIPHKPTTSSTKRTGSVKFTERVQSAQRRAVITLLRAMRTTAGDVLNAHAFIPPPHLLFLRALTNSATRLLTLPNIHPLQKPVKLCIGKNVKRHRSPLHILFQTTNAKPKNYETILPARRRRNYEVLADIHINDDRSKAIEESKAIMGLAAYTDGSGLDGRIGAAAVLMLNGTELSTLRYKLGSETEHTVYEAEILAVILALHILTTIRRNLRSVTIGVDNQAVLLGLKNQKSKPGHYLLDKIHDALEDFQVKQARNRGRTVEGYRIGKGRGRLEDGSKGWRDWNLKKWCRIKFVWTPGHENIEGNEKADEEAKLAATTGSSPRRKLPTFIHHKDLPISISATRQDLKSDMKKRWKLEWKVSHRHPNSSNIDRTLPSDNFMHIIGQLRRPQASILIQLRTGHLPLNNVLHRIKKSDTPDCPHCEKGTRETPMHYLFFCPRYEPARRRIHAATQKEKNLFSFLLGNRTGIPLLLHYINETGRFRTTFGNVKPTPDFIIQEKKSKERSTNQQPPALD